MRNGLAECDAPTGNIVECVNGDPATMIITRAYHLASQGKSAESEPLWRQALHLRPDDIDVLNELGLAVWRQGRAAEAEPIYRHAQRINPDDFRILTNLGLSLYDQNRVEEAAECYRRAIEIKSDAFDALMNLGLVSSDQGRFDEAKALLDAAHKLQPDSASVFQNYGINLGRQGRWHEAIEQYEHGLRLEPDFPRMHMNLAYALLCLGDYRRGWQEHEWRLKWRDYGGIRVDREYWNGDDFQGRTILLHAEQGLGDTLQFIRFAPLVKAGAAALSSCAVSRDCSGWSLDAWGSIWLSTGPLSNRTVISTHPC